MAMERAVLVQLTAHRVGQEATGRHQPQQPSSHVLALRVLCASKLARSCQRHESEDDESWGDWSGHVANVAKEHHKHSRRASEGALWPAEPAEPGE